MWASKMYLLPLFVMLSSFRLKQETTLDGDLQDEFAALVRELVPKDKLIFQKNKKLKATINRTYAEGTPMHTVLEDIFARYHLTIVISETDSVNGALTVMFQEGAAWKV